MQLNYESSNLYTGGLLEVEQRLVTVSDLNYAIEKKFREAGIEVPFPQRDLHVRSMESAVNWRIEPGGTD